MFEAIRWVLYGLIVFNVGYLNVWAAVGFALTFILLEVALHGVYPILHNNDVIAYNYSSDKRMLFQTARKYNLDIPEVSWHCTMKAYKKFTLRSANTNLTQACIEMNVKLENAHNALEDAVSTARLMYRIAQNYKYNEEKI